MPTTTEGNMLRTTAHFDAAKAELAAYVQLLPIAPAVRKELSSKIARFAAAAVRQDRNHRYTSDSLAKLVDVFFNGRQA
jgi:hypothetical protein